MGENKIISTVPGLILWIIASMAAGWIGSQFMPGEWYVSLVKPAWTPPNVVFAPVWTALYVLMGVAAWLVWRRSGFSGAMVPLVLFIVQLVLNALWSYLFFGAHQPMLAFFEIVILWIVILLTLVCFWRMSLLAGVLLLPYLCWVGFASALNFQIWRLNA
ncbi:MAG: tryptophan-rich sensory protein [Candidatus Latescibacteria bacterium]|nr:tryptophan-rich sensory protein [Candidatus Latescibacterota bacterium]NIO27159.1 tryptophan-rich sensory protein [Candidatus Latescibacterota bacterium]NIO54683.1 tryptophan-rich sensory protein [Candidatus Latescibacterota bacterium]NIT00766.1 tryptophan-rich sensory protein [Candidatus Latescibacterota bacterium]NIT37689.1 tryptophan-rich sensory protein [Candidatus Latescibacterota bacterium]